MRIENKKGQISYEKDNKLYYVCYVCNGWSIVCE